MKYKSIFLIFRTLVAGCPIVKGDVGRAICQTVRTAFWYATGNKAKKDFIWLEGLWLQHYSSSDSNFPLKAKS
jgi:hypothetical protein